MESLVLETLRSLFQTEKQSVEESKDSDFSHCRALIRDADKFEDFCLLEGEEKCYRCRRFSNLFRNFKMIESRKRICHANKAKRGSEEALCILDDAYASYLLMIELIDSRCFSSNSKPQNIFDIFHKDTVEFVQANVNGNHHNVESAFCFAEGVKIAMELFKAGLTFTDDKPEVCA